jgi:hypothetical protein
MTQPQPLQSKPMLPTFLSTSQETRRTSRNFNTAAKDLLDALVILQCISGITLGLVLGQLLITLSFVSKPLIIRSAPTPTPAPSVRSFVYR